MNVRITTPSALEVGEGFDLTVDLIGDGDERLVDCCVKGTLYAIGVSEVKSRARRSITFRAVLFGGPSGAPAVETLRALCRTSANETWKGWKIVGLA